MQMGMVGLGRMGANMVRRLMRDGHECVVYDVRAESVAAMVDEGAVGAASLGDLVEKLAPPRAVWMMVPAAITHDTIEPDAQIALSLEASALQLGRFGHLLSLGK